jgi:hypothetical protein
MRHGGRSPSEQTTSILNAARRGKDELPVFEDAAFGGATFEGHVCVTRAVPREREDTGDIRIAGTVYADVTGGLGRA